MTNAINTFSNTEFLLYYPRIVAIDNKRDTHANRNNGVSASVLYSVSFTDSPSYDCTKVYTSNSNVASLRTSYYVGVFASLEEACKLALLNYKLLQNTFTVEYGDDESLESPEFTIDVLLNSPVKLSTDAIVLGGRTIKPTRAIAVPASDFSPELAYSQLARFAGQKKVSQGTLNASQDKGAVVKALQCGQYFAVDNYIIIHW